MEPLTSNFWLNEAALLYGLVFDLIDDAAERGLSNAVREIVQLLLNVPRPSVDLDLLNVAAHEYARQHSFNLVSQITTTSKHALQSALSEWIYSGEPLPKLIERIEPMYGPVRANMIATTEITRVYAESNVLGWRAYGVDAQKWQTAVDDTVCEICAPRHGKEYRLGEPEGTPPGHVNCRCWIQPVVRVPEIR